MQRREQLPAFQQILDEVRTITDDDQWKTYWLLSAGMDCSENRKHSPQPTRLLKQIPGASTAFFSIPAPGHKIPPHPGTYNHILHRQQDPPVKGPTATFPIPVGKPP